MWKMAKLWLLVKARHANFIAFSARTKLTYLWFSSIILFDGITIIIFHVMKCYKGEVKVMYLMDYSKSFKYLLINICNNQC